MATTLWTCEACGVSGEVEVPDGTGLYDAIERLRDSHRAASPECPGDLTRIKVTPKEEPAAHA